MSIVLLGLRSTIKENIGATPAEFVCGATLRLPADFLALPTSKRSQQTLIKQLRDAMSQLSPSQTNKHTIQTLYINKDLATSTHAFVRNDSVKATIVPPYDESFRINDRQHKFFTLEIKNKLVKISVNRRKPAYLEPAYTNADVTNAPQSSPTIIPSAINNINDSTFINNRSSSISNRKLFRDDIMAVNSPIATIGNKSAAHPIQSILARANSRKIQMI